MIFHWGVPSRSAVATAMPTGAGHFGVTCATIVLNFSMGARMYTRKLLRFAVAAAVLAHVSFAQAQDAGRVEQLEKEVQSLKFRLSAIEAALGSTAKPATVAKSPSVWRQLKKDLSPDQVRAILGEPDRIQGGAVTHWYYPNAGDVDFIDDRVYGWSEPR